MRLTVIAEGNAKLATHTLGSAAERYGQTLSGLKSPCHKKITMKNEADRQVPTSQPYLKIVLGCVVPRWETIYTKDMVHTDGVHKHPEGLYRYTLLVSILQAVSSLPQ
jgi:hypothetical protein